MDETSTTAMLVGTRDMVVAQSNALTATLSRDEIEGALASEPPDDLILEILRSVEGHDQPERRTVNVAWDRTDLESVLSDADAEAITFSFDPAELQRILSEPDVEGHGLREAAVVLSIAAAAAVGGASTANAEPGGAWAPQAQAVSAHDESTLADRGIAAGTVAAVHDESTLAARGIESGTVASTAHDESTLAARGIEPATLTAASAHDESTLAARGIEPGTLVAGVGVMTSPPWQPVGSSPGRLRLRRVMTSRRWQPAASSPERLRLAVGARRVHPGGAWHRARNTRAASVHDESTLAARGIEPGTLAAGRRGTTSPPWQRVGSSPGHCPRCTTRRRSPPAESSRHPPVRKWPRTRGRASTCRG